MTSSFHNHSGHAVLEFAIILPMVILIILGTIEFTQIFRIKEVVSVIGREAAKEAFRECYEGIQATCFFGQPKTDACIEQFTQGMQDAVERISPGAVLTISLYDWDPGIPGGVVAPHADLIGITRDDFGNPTRTEFSDVIITERLGGLMETKQYIVTSEIFYQHNWMLGSGIFPESEFYEATIY